MMLLPTLLHPQLFGEKGDLGLNHATLDTVLQALCSGAFGANTRLSRRIKCTRKWCCPHLSPDKRSVDAGKPAAEAQALVL